MNTPKINELSNILKTKGERVVALAALGLLLYTSALALTGQVILAMQQNQTISNSGQVKTIGVGVYWNPDATNMVTSIDWGTLKPGASVDSTCYIQNDGNSALTLSMNTSNWDPTNAPDYISLIWDYNGELINPDETVPVIFTLSVSNSIEGITNFSFDIFIEGVTTTSTTANLLVTDSTPEGPVPYMIDGNSGYQTGTTYSLETGIHIIELPSPYTSSTSGLTYTFSYWDDNPSLVNPTRQIDLSTDTTLQGIYTQT